MDSTEDDCYGPALPPHMRKPSTTVAPSPSEPSVIGPALPPNFKVPESSDRIQEPPPDSSDSDDSDGGFGPLPADSDRITKAQLELEERALEYQIMGVPSTSSSRNDGGREEWMTELPEVRKVTDLGLGARQFRSKEGPDFSDRSSWTDTPNGKKAPKPEDPKGRMEFLQDRERDKAMEKMKRKHEKKHKRDKSLLEMHEKKIKKKKVKIIAFVFVAFSVLNLFVCCFFEPIPEEAQGRETGAKALLPGDRHEREQD